MAPPENPPTARNAAAGATPAEHNPSMESASWQVLVAGSESAFTRQLLSIQVETELNRLSRAELVYLDGDAAARNFPASNSDEFLPGSTVEIKAGYGADMQTLFKGVVVRSGITARQHEPTTFYVSLRHAAVNTTLNRKNKVFLNMADSDLFREILSAYSLESNLNDTSSTHENLVQYNCTDWDFMNMRAEANGLLLWLHPDSVRIVAPDISAEPAITLKYGSSILSFETEMEGQRSFSQYDATRWSYKEQERTEVEEQGNAGETRQGNVDSSQLADAMQNATMRLQVSGTEYASSEIESFTRGRVIANNMARIKGRVRCLGAASLFPGSIIRLEGMGDRFNGNAFVGSVHHLIANGTWETEIGIGMDESPYATRFDDIMPLKASGMLPAIHGLQIGVVTKIHEDPQGEGRIQVNLPATGNPSGSIWARVCTLDAGKERGTFFYPELGDEVIVGFIDDDPRSAVVLGMLHSSGRPTPFTPEEDNHEKGVVTRSKLKMAFHDEKKSVTIETPGGKKLILDEDAGVISMEDENGNKLVLDSDGITLESSKAIILKAGTDLKLEGVNIEGKADASLSLEGSASAEVKASGTLTLQGAMVQIN